MEFGLAGRSALVTAASRGIGRGIAIALAQEGVRVTSVARNETDLDSLSAEIGGSGAGHQTFAMDLTDEEAPGNLFDLIREAGPLPEIVVHNLGGTGGIVDPFCSVADWRIVYRLNLEVAVELNRMLIPPMQERRWGRVVHISSIAAMENHGPATYCAIKAALTAYARSLGGYVAKDGVVVSSVLPGAVYTEGGYWDKASRDSPEHVQKFLAERQRIGRFGRVEEIANFVTFLCSDIASFNTGSAVPIDGGQGRGYFGQ